MSEREQTTESARAQVALIELNRERPPVQHALYQETDPSADYYDGPTYPPASTVGPVVRR